MNRSSRLSSPFIFPLLLIVLALVTHWQWFKPGATFTEGDWEFWFTESARQMGRFWDIWDTSWYYHIGQLRLHAFAFRTIWAALTQLGATFQLAAQLSFFWPIALGSFLSPYFLAKKLTADRLVAFVLAIFYGTTTHFLLIQSGHLPLAFVYALIPLVFYLYLEALDNPWPGWWTLFALSYWVALSYELRGTYILTLLLIAHFAYFHLKDIGRYWKPILGSAVLVLILAGYIWLPYLFGGVRAQISDFTAARDLFGNNLYDIKHALAIANPLWTGEATDRTFTQQPVLPHLWLMPLVALLSIIPLLKKPEQRRGIIFYGLVSLVGILLTKQSAPPFAGLYHWLYLHFPGFNLFREASKFYVVTTLGYLGLMGYALVYLKTALAGKGRLISYGLAALVALVGLWNTKPLVTGTIGTVFTPRQVPTDYLILKDFLLKEPEYSRTLWLPTVSRWSLHTVLHPLTSGLGLLRESWKQAVTDDPQRSSLPIQEQLIALLRQPYANQLLDYSSVKYVIVPIPDIADNLSAYGERQYYIDQLNSIDYLKKIDIGTSGLAVYLNQGALPHVTVSNQITALDSLDESRLFSFLIKDQASPQLFAVPVQPSEPYPNTPHFRAPILTEAATNLISNPSFEAGPWQPRETDCYLAGDAANIGTYTQTEQKTAGQQGLALTAEKHNACTHMIVPVQENANYYVRFDYRAEAARTGSLCLSFDDPKHSVFNQQLATGRSDWQSFSTVITVPAGAHSANLCLVVTPDPNQRASYFFDNFGFAPIDPKAAQYSLPALPHQPLPKMSFTSPYPTKYLVEISAATTPFFLTVGESYHPGWRARLVSAGNRSADLPSQSHYRFGGHLNSWLIDPAELCRSANSCRQDDHGYSLKVAIEFWPQRWLLLGSMVTLVGLTGALGYLVWRWRRRR